MFIYSYFSFDFLFNLNAQGQEQPTEDVHENVTYIKKCFKNKATPFLRKEENKRETYFVFICKNLMRFFSIFPSRRPLLLNILSKRLVLLLFNPSLISAVQ